MYLKLDFQQLVEVTNVYMVKRRTVWQIVDHDTLVILVTDGHCQIEMDGEEYLLEPGSLFIVPAGHHYLRRPVENEMCTLYYIHLNMRDNSELCDDAAAIEEIAHRKQEHAKIASNGENETRQYQCRHDYCLQLHTDLSGKLEYVKGLYEEAIETALKDHVESRTKLSLLAADLLICAAESALRESKGRAVASATPTKKLRKVFAYIKLHSKENITLEELCTICNFSRQHLIRVFRTEFGMTPKSYISNYRINCAKELFFREPTLSVKEVAYEMGFEDQHYFSRLFTRVTGQSPSAYKEHLKNFDPSKQ